MIIHKYEACFSSTIKYKSIHEHHPKMIMNAITYGYKVPWITELCNQPHQSIRNS